MAEHSDATMDMDAHRETYKSFLHITTIVVAFCVAIVIFLAIGNAGAWGLAGLGVFLAIIAAIVGFLMNGSPIPIIAVTLGILVLKLLFG
jgi:Bacterial aa3 type cytochrome c oxidase subunit IV